MTNTISDQQQRLRALAPDQSFIVQAPAGSGKTELLTQRVLTLLASVEHPEEITAITFTRKAAREMHDRIIQALHLAKGPKPEAEHAQHSWQLAKKALARDQELSWSLLQNPNRLRVQTIDAFCAYLTRHLPIAAGTGAQLNILDDATGLYQQTARSLFAELDSDYEWSDALATLLLHVDNLQSRAEVLLANMLANRDQWLPYLGYHDNPDELRPLLEQGLTQLATDHLQQLQGEFDQIMLPELVELLQFAGKQLNDDCLKAICLTDFSFEVKTLSLWQSICQLLLTKEGKFRKRVTKSQGFPAPSKAKDKIEKFTLQTMKERITVLLEHLANFPEVEQQLQIIAELPGLHYQAQQWEIVSALMTLLPNLVAQLMVNFQQKGIIDHIEISQRALLALGDDEHATDLALVLDYQLQHLLVDEFQDTSTSQFRLLQKLTKEWQPDDGHSLFLVGDPMQSIYRFRKAEVGLFLQAKQHGIGEVRLESLSLTSNFRAEAPLVEWNNQLFSQVFPENNDISAGAIRYHAADAVIPEQATTGVHIHPHLEDHQHEADSLLSIIKDTHPSQSIGILVRARSHLIELLPKLRDAGIAYKATELETLLDKPCVTDLLSLTKALLHPADRLAWLSILRAPWCGLSLADLHVIGYQQQSQSLWERILNYHKLALSADGKQRLQRLVEVLDQSLQQKRRLPLAAWVENTWLTLGGPSCLKSHDELRHTDDFFQLLRQYSIGGDIDDWEALQNHLAISTVNVLPEQKTNIEIMTIHKAKGLEFDVVILPKLGQGARNSDSPLLLWMERNSEAGQHLLVAPIRHSQESHDPIYRYLQRLEKSKDRLEQARLFYVAATRAKSQLHLLATAKLRELDDGQVEAKATDQSFLQLLWPIAEETFQSLLTATPIEPQNEIEQQPTIAKLGRLPKHWQLPNELNPNSLQLNLAANPVQSYDMTPSTTLYTAIGTVTHRLLQRIAEQGLANWSQISEQQHWIKLQLQNLGVAQSQIKLAMDQVEQAIHYTLNDERGRWILSPHQQAQSEYPLTAIINDKLLHLIIDRTFVDELGQRWIIDYKTSYQQEKSQEFIQQQIITYTPQLQQYAKAFSMQDNNQIKLGLYFPLLEHWYEVTTI